MLSKRKNQKAFTLVEIVIVVSVIAILATVSVFAYNGMQTRARNAQTAAAAKAYLDALNSYFQANKKYPDQADLNSYVCLGEKYTSSCWLGQGKIDTAFINELKRTYSSNLPSPSFVSGTWYSGIIFARAIEGNINRMVDGIQTSMMIYSVEGNQPCPVGPVLSPGPGGGANEGGDPYHFTFFSQTPSNGITLMGSNGAPNECFVALPREF